MQFMERLNTNVQRARGRHPLHGAELLLRAIVVVACAWVVARLALLVADRVVYP